MAYRLDVNKGASDVYTPGETYIEVYSEGELIGNVTLTEINQLSSFIGWMTVIKAGSLKTEEILKQNGIT